MPLPGDDIGYEDIVTDPVWWSANADFPAGTAVEEDMGYRDSRAVDLRDYSSRPNRSVLALAAQVPVERQ